PVLHPKGGVQQRVVLLGSPDLEPDPAQPRKRGQSRLGDVILVVPDQPGAVHRRVDGERREEDRGGAPPGGGRGAAAEGGHGKGPSGAACRRASASRASAKPGLSSSVRRYSASASARWPVIAQRLPRL